MKTKLKFLIKQSIKKKTDTKWFKAANILVCLLLIVVINLDKIITFFGGNFNEPTKIYVVDEVNSFEEFKNNFEVLTKDNDNYKHYSLENTTEDIEKLKENIKDKDDIILNIKKSDTNYIDAKVISYDQLTQATENILSTSLNNIKTLNILKISGLSEEELASLTSPVNIERVVTNEKLNGDTSTKDLVTNLIIIILIIPFFILITMLTQMIGAEINDEKSTRGMEIIISNVSPKTHFISKIISSTLFVIGETVLLFVYVLIAVLIRKLLGLSMISGAMASQSSEYASVITNLTNNGVIPSLIKGIPVILILFISSFLLYAILAGVLASMTTNIEDFQQLQTPLMIILMVGYYIAIMASTFDGSVFVKIVSYIPMLSFLVAPVIYLLGQISLIELLASTCLCVLFTYLAFHYGLRIYKVGILNYSSKDLWKKIFKSVKNN